MVNNEYTYEDPREWKQFPPRGDVPRLERYEMYHDLLMGNHRDVAGRQQDKYFDRPEIAKVLDAGNIKLDLCNDTYVSTDYCKMASLIFADILFGKRPVFRVGDGDSIQQKRVNQIAIDNMLDAINHQQAVMASSSGDAIYRVRWGKMQNWRKEGVVIEALPPRTYFPILPPGNIKDNSGAAICSQFEYDKKKYLYRELYEPGTIRYELWRLRGRTLSELVPLDTVPAYASLLATADGYDNIRRDGNALVCETDYPGLFVEHVPNWTLPDQFFGISDYSPAVISNQLAINEELTGMLRVILKNMDPKLVLPPGLMTYDEASGRWFVKREDLDAVEVPDEVAAVLPRYVTWDAQLGAAQANIDRLFESMMLSFQISPAIFGWNKFGAADSAKALKLRMVLTLWRVAQKWQYFDAALKNILYAAQFLDGRYGPEKYEPLEVETAHPDPMPVDEAELAALHGTLYVSGLESQMTAVKEVQGIDGDALDGELQAIREDEARKKAQDKLEEALYYAGSTPVDDGAS